MHVYVLVGGGGFFFVFLSLLVTYRQWRFVSFLSRKIDFVVTVVLEGAATMLEHLDKVPYAHMRQEILKKDFYMDRNIVHAIGVVWLDLQ